MPSPSNAVEQSLVLVFGEDEFGVKRRARQVYEQWRIEAGGMDHEIVDASVTTGGEALRALAKLREALQTLPFFGSSKVVWFRDCSFLGDDRTATVSAVVESVNALADELRRFRWDNVRLLISSIKVDRRKTFFKTLDKIARVEVIEGLSYEDRDWPQRAEAYVLDECRLVRKSILDDALAELVTAVGPNQRQLSNEIEKLALYAGERSELTLADVEAVVTRQKHSEAFALGEALGDRDLPRVFRTLDEVIWEMRSDSKKSMIGVLYGLISKVRTLLLIREMLRAGLLRSESNYSRFKQQLEGLPRDVFPDDKRYNPLLMHPFTLFKALPQASKYTTDELVRALDLLLGCNHRLVSSGLDEALVVQQTLARIVSPNDAASR